MSDSNRELMDRVKNGDMSAFDLIVQKHKASLINFAYRFLGDHETAEDIAQETFLRVYRNAGNYRSEKAQLNTWMYRIAANLCKNELRRRNRQSKVLVNSAIGSQDGTIENVLDPSHEPDHQLEKEELKKKLSEAILCLPEKLRTVLILRDIEGMTYEEICQVIKKPSGTVKSRLNRARLMLRSRMAAYVESYSNLGKDLHT